MQPQRRTLVCGGTVFLVLLTVALHSQGGAPTRFNTPPTQVVAIRAGRLFDSRSGTLVTNQVDRSSEAIASRTSGPSVAIPPDARVIDLSTATVLPGMIDAHVHLFPADDLSESTRTIVGVANAQTDLNAGFTTVLDMDSRGGFGTVDLRNAINRGVVMGPRMQVVGQSLNQRASTPYPALFKRFIDRFTEDKNPNSPWLGRAAVREAKLHGVDWVKIYTTQDFVGDEYNVWKPDGTLVNSPSLTEEEVMAIVDEAHRLGLKVACHTYGGEGQLSCLKAGVDAPNHLTDLDDASLKLLVDKKLPFEMTVDDLVSLEPGDLKTTGGKKQPPARWRSRRSGRRAPRVCPSSSAAARRPPHSARHGSRPVRVLREVGDDACAGAADGVSARGDDAELPLGAARSAASKRGSLPISSPSPAIRSRMSREMQRVRFVMKGGLVVRNDR